MSPLHPARREFLQLLSGYCGAAWLTANWPAIVSAAEHAHHAAKSPNPKFEALTAEQAREVDALAACIIPTDDSAGAREAGVVYFIDQALKGFASEALPTYQKGLEVVQSVTVELFPAASRFSAASSEQQIKIFSELEAESNSQKGVSRRVLPSGTSDFMQTLRLHTISGYLVDPEGGGNRDFAGWKAIGRDPAHNFTSPFGSYDKDYPGWQPAAVKTETR